MSTSEVLGFCFPVDADRAVEFAKNTFQDFSLSAVVIGIAGFSLSALLSYLFVASVRIPMLLRFAVWLSIIVVLLVFSGGAFFVFQEAKDAEYRSGSDSVSKIQIRLLKGLASFLAIMAGLWLCLIVFLRHKIALAISLLHETSKAVVSMPLMMLSPFFNVAIIAMFTLIWIIYCVYIVTSGEIVDTTVNGYTYKEVRVSEEARKALLFMAFMWLWTACFVHGASQWICAHTVLTWYFRPINGSVGSIQVIRSTFVFIRYHIGTVAFGSLLLAIIQAFRAVLVYIKAKLKNKESRIVKLTICFCSCCLFCLSKIIKFIDRNAYIHSSLGGTSFCVSAKRAFGLILRNLGRVATVSVLSSVVIYVGKVSVTVSSAGIAYYYMKYYMTEDMNGYVVPTLFVAVIAYFCSSLFLDTISMTSDTVLQVTKCLNTIKCLL